MRKEIPSCILGRECYLGKKKPRGDRWLEEDGVTLSGKRLERD